MACFGDTDSFKLPLQPETSCQTAQAAVLPFFMTRMSTQDNPDIIQSEIKSADGGRERSKPTPL